MLYLASTISSLLLGADILFVSAQSHWPSGTQIDGVGDEGSNFNSYAIDGDISTFIYWEAAGLTKSPVTLTITPPGAISLSGITLVSSPDGWPSYYKVEGSSDNTNWDYLAELQDITTFLSTATFPKPAEYQKIRITINDATSAGGVPIHVSINEVYPVLVDETISVTDSNTNTYPSLDQVPNTSGVTKTDAASDSNPSLNANVDAHVKTNAKTKAVADPTTNTQFESNSRTQTDTNSKTGVNDNRILNLGSGSNNNTITGSDNQISNSGSGSNKNLILNSGPKSDKENASTLGAKNSNNNSISNSGSGSNTNNVQDSSNNDISNKGSGSNVNNIQGSDSDLNSNNDSNSNSGSGDIINMARSTSRTDPSPPSDLASRQSPNISKTSQGEQVGIILGAVAGSCVILVIVLGILFRIGRRRSRGQPQMWDCLQKRKRLFSDEKSILEVPAETLREELDTYARTLGNGRVTSGMPRAELANKSPPKNGVSATPRTPVSELPDSFEIGRSVSSNLRGTDYVVSPETPRRGLPDLPQSRNPPTRTIAEH